jgi:hypothetical protein
MEISYKAIEIDFKLLEKYTPSNKENTIIHYKCFLHHTMMKEIPSKKNLKTYPFPYFPPTRNHNNSRKSFILYTDIINSIFSLESLISKTEQFEIFETN